MATKVGTSAPTFSFFFDSIQHNNTSILSSCVTNTNTSRRRRTHSFPYEFGHFGGAPLVPAIRAASGPNTPEPTSSSNSPNSLPPPTLQDDLIYLLKLVAGSVLGAALIKYGSAIVPDITRPNITQALLIISTPVVVAVLLLFNGSRRE